MSIVDYKGFRRTTSPMVCVALPAYSIAEFLHIAEFWLSPNICSMGLAL